MRAGAAWRSKLGAVLAVVYIALFAAEYADYRHHQGTWLADLGLNVLAIPYVLVGRVFTLDPAFELNGTEPWGLVPAMAFCAALVYLIGLGVERVGRRLAAQSNTDS